MARCVPRTPRLRLAGGLLLDRDRPWEVVDRSTEPLLEPSTDAERVGIVPNVVFPGAALVDRESDRLAIYYGAADTVICT